MTIDFGELEGAIRRLSPETRRSAALVFLRLNAKALDDDEPELAACWHQLAAVLADVTDAKRREQTEIDSKFTDLVIGSVPDHEMGGYVASPAEILDELHREGWTEE